MEQVLKYVDQWEKFEYKYHPLPNPDKETGQAIGEEQKTRLVRLAESNPNWYAAYLFAVLSVNTSAGPKEVLTLRIRDTSISPARSTCRVSGQRTNIACGTFR